MWPFSKSVAKDDLAGIKTVSVNGFKFKIKRVNALLDFQPDKMPQIFADFISRRQRKEEPGFEQAKKAQADMYAMVEAGLVEPDLIKVGAGEQRGKEEGITVEDIFRDGDTGPKLYFEILAHSLNRFRGLKGVFFILRTRHALLTSWRNAMAQDLRTSPLLQENSA